MCLSLLKLARVTQYFSFAFLFQKKSTRHRADLQPFFTSKYNSSSIAGTNSYQHHAPQASGVNPQGISNKRQLSNSFMSHTFNPAFHGSFTSKHLQGLGGASSTSQSHVSNLQLPYLVNQNNNYQVSYQRYQGELKKKPATLPQSNLPKIEG